jgi:hypothetical protein
MDRIYILPIYQMAFAIHPDLSGDEPTRIAQETP